MAMSKPFNRTFNLADGTKLYEGALQLNRLFTEASTVAERLALIADPAFRGAVRESVDNPNRDPDAGPTLPPPGWAVLHVNQASRPENEKLLGRSLVDIAAERDVHPTDARHRRQRGPHRRVPLEDRDPGGSKVRRSPRTTAHDRRHLDGGAHLDRDDGAEAHRGSSSTGCASGRASPSRRACARSPPSRRRCAASPIAGLLVGAADLMIFDPDTVGPDQKWLAHDFPNSAARWTSRPKGVHATIVNGVPIVLDGEPRPTSAFPGQVLSPS